MTHTHILPTWFEANKKIQKVYVGGLLGTKKSRKIAQTMKGHVQHVWGRVFAKKTAGVHLAMKGLQNLMKPSKITKNTSFDTLKPFPASYSTIWHDS